MLQKPDHFQYYKWLMFFEMVHHTRALKEDGIEKHTGQQRLAVNHKQICAFMYMEQNIFLILASHLVRDFEKLLLKLDFHLPYFLQIRGCLHFEVQLEALLVERVSQCDY